MKRSAALLLLGGVLVLSWRGWERGRALPRAAVPAVDAEAFAALIGRRPAAAGELWERLKAMGLSAAVLREERLSELAARGEVLYFSRAEIEKWRAAGLIAPDSALRGGTLIVRDPGALERATASLAAGGVDTATSSVAGLRALILPMGVDLSAVNAGLDPAAVSTLSAAGLIPAADSGPTVALAGRVFDRRTLSVRAGAAAISRAAYARPLRLIVFEPQAGLGLEENLDHLREALRILRSFGLPSLPPAASIRQPASGPHGRWRWALLVLLGAAGPLLAVRAALDASHRARPLACRWSWMGAPAPQVLAGLASVWVCAVMTGLAVIGLAPVGWEEQSHAGWTAWTLGAPLVFGFAGLFGAGSQRMRLWRSSVRWKDLAVLAALGTIGGLLLSPRALIHQPAFWGFLERLPVPWWWSWHWREALIGAPALAGGLFLAESSAGGASPSDALRDPRGWLLLGLLAPAALIVSLGSGEPVMLTLAQDAAAYAWGLLLAALIFARGGPRS